MEEKKTKTGKPAKEEPQMSYAELNDVCNQLYMQNQQMSRKIRDLQSIHTRIPYLFKVIENASVFSNTLVDKCAEEIEALLYPVVTENPEGNESTGE